MTSQAIERHQAAAGGALALNDREIRSIEFQARAIAALDRRLDDDVERRKEQALALAVTLYSLGLPVTVTNAKKLHLIGDEVVESAQLLLGLLAMHGHEVRIVEDSDERAMVRGHRHGGGEPHTVTYTIDQARRSGALDEWVEKWEKTDSGKKYPVRYFLVFEGKPNDVPPEPWAKTLIDRHQVKRMDAWHKYRSDMLVNRALRRLAKRMGADALLGVGGLADDPPARIPARDDDVVLDVEEAETEPGVVRDEPDPAAVHRNECGRIASAMGRIPDGLWRQQWAKAWREAGLPSSAHELAPEQLEPARQLIRQYVALAVLAEAGISSTVERHTFVDAATNGATESTKGLTAEQFDAVYRAATAAAAERNRDDHGLPAEPEFHDDNGPGDEPAYGPGEEPFE